MKGGWITDERSIQEQKKSTDYIISHIGRWLQSLFKSSNLDHPKFSVYEVNLLKILNFYLSSCSSKVAPYLVIQFMFPLLLLVKRQIIELSHPFFEKIQYTNRSKVLEAPLIIKNRSLMQYFLDIVTNLLVNNKYVERLISSTFHKNNCFMQVIEYYLEAMLQD